MAPNIKENAAVVDSLATLNVNDIVKSQYLPLDRIVEVSSSSEEASSPPPPPKEVHDSHCEWNVDNYGSQAKSYMPADTRQELIKQILRHEEIRELFSVTNMEAKLVQEAERIRANGTDNREYVNTNEYWHFPGESNTQDITEQGDMVQNVVHNASNLTTVDSVRGDNGEATKQALIQRVLLEEELRQAVSLERMEACLKVDADRREANCAKVSVERESTSHNAIDSSYWEWHDEVVITPHAFAASREITL